MEVRSGSNVVNISWDSFLWETGQISNRGGQTTEIREFYRSNTVTSEGVFHIHTHTHTHTHTPHTHTTHTHTSHTHTHHTHTHHTHTHPHTHTLHTTASFVEQKNTCHNNECRVPENIHARYFGHASHAFSDLFSNLKRIFAAFMEKNKHGFTSWPLTNNYTIIFIPKERLLQ